MTDATDSLSRLAAALAEAKAARVTLDRSIVALEQVLEQGVQDGLQDLPKPAVADSDLPGKLHRAEHRPGVPARLDADAELRDFVLARIHNRSFPQLAAEVAQNFPPDRRVSHAAIHKWWRRQPSHARATVKELKG